MRRSAMWTALFACLAFAMTAWPIAAADEPKPADNPPAEKKSTGLPDFGDLTKISVEFGLPAADGFKLAGRDARQQLVVTGHYASGQVGDLTHKVMYSVEPAGILEVDSTGLVAPLAEGSATVTVRDASGKTATTAASVSQIAQDLPVNFPNDVVPVFTKFTCNSGGCHGKASGQNGFRLSLLGFEPPEDYEHLVKEGRGRRVFPAAPDRSLLLQKASGSVPHGGGARIEADSAPYRVLRRWIEQGMPYGKPDDPVVARIEVYPPERTMGRN
ncbi:MAG: Ig-like domain-containing protein, partial [Pirellulaceae bacterium]